MLDEGDRDVLLAVATSLAEKGSSRTTKVVAHPEAYDPMAARKPAPEAEDFHRCITCARTIGRTAFCGHCGCPQPIYAVGA